MGKTYLMGDIAKKLAIHKTTVFRSIKELEIEAINENSRKYENSPKKYSEEAKKLIVANLVEEEQRTEMQNKALQEHFETLRNVSETIEADKDNVNEGEKEEHFKAFQEHNSNGSSKVIELLERQLEAKGKELDRAYQEKQDLIRLLDQQQQLSLQANQKIEMLENREREITEESEKDELQKKRRWFDFFLKRED